MGELDKVVGVFKKYGVECGEDIFQAERITEEALYILNEIFSIVEPLVVDDTENEGEEEKLVLSVTHCRYCNAGGRVDSERDKHIDHCNPINTVWVDCPKCGGTKHLVKMGKDVSEKKDGEE